MIFLILPGLVLTGLMDIVSKRFETVAARVFGRRLYLLLFGWLGTAVHELSHLFMCIVFRHKVDKVRFFILNPADNVMGYVHHRYNPKSLYQSAGNLFIGIAPVFGGALFILLSAQIFFPGIFSISDLDVNSSEGLLMNLLKISMLLMVEIVSPANFNDPEYYFFLYIAFCIGSSMKLSRADFKGAKKGLIVVLCSILFVNAVAVIIDPVWVGTLSNIVMYISTKLFFVYSLIVIVLFINLFFTSLIKVISKKI